MSNLEIIEEKRLIKKKIGLLSVISISISGIIGSGWLFTAYIGAKEAGSGVFISWIITLIFFILMALCLSEIVSIFPIRGLIGRLGVLSHNRFFGSIFAFAVWLELVGSIPGEAQATVQYLASLSKSMYKILINNNQLSTAGLLFTFGFMVVYWLINIFGIKFFTKVNNIITLFKIIIPILTALVIIHISFHPINFTIYKGKLLPYGINSIFIAITSAGMIYIFNGFQLCTSFASEIKKPHVNIPIGMIIGIIVCFIIYILLQLAFMGGISSSEIERYGWHALNYESPFIQLASMLGLNIMVIVIYAGAIAGPAGTSITFVGSASRVLYGMSREKQMPKIFSKINERFGFSLSSMIFNFIISSTFLSLFHSWEVLIPFITALIILMYMAIPLSIVSLRKGRYKLQRKFTLPFATPIGYILFIVQSVFFIFIGSKNMVYLSIAITAFITAFIIINRPKNKKYSIKDVIYTSIPLPIFIWLITLIILMGPKTYGGIGIMDSIMTIIAIIAIDIIAFHIMTSKTFIYKCLDIKEEDNIKTRFL